MRAAGNNLQEAPDALADSAHVAALEERIMPPLRQPQNMRQQQRDRPAGGQQPKQFPRRQRQDRHPPGLVLATGGDQHLQTGLEIRHAEIHRHIALRRDGKRRDGNIGPRLRHRLQLRGLAEVGQHGPSGFDAKPARHLLPDLDAVAGDRRPRRLDEGRCVAGDDTQPCNVLGSHRCHAQQSGQ